MLPAAHHIVLAPSSRWTIDGSVSSVVCPLNRQAKRCLAPSICKLLQAAGCRCCLLCPHLAPVLGGARICFRHATALAHTNRTARLTHGVQEAEADPAFLLTRLAPVLELTWRSLNGLLERFHHSYFLYLLVSPDAFVTVEAYLAPVICFLLALAVQVRLPIGVSAFGARDLLPAGAGSTGALRGKDHGWS